MAARRHGPEFVFLPLGGVGEIGMNCALYGYGEPDDRSWIMVDCGMTFGDARSTPGVDLIYPDIGFIEEERTSLLAIVLTHAHEDHLGALLDLWPRLDVPVYATAFPAALLEAKAAENPRVRPVPVTVVEQGARITLGPFTVEFVPVSHSIPEPNALVIETDLGRIVHSGDWKIDPRPGVGLPIDEARLRAVGASGVRALVCDSTNAVREGRSPSEAAVAAGLKEVVAAARHRVAVTLFSSNVARIRAIAEAAAAAERHVVVMGRALRRIIQVAGGLGYLDGLPPFLTEDEFGHLPREKVLLLCTGSQGEERAALARIAADDHPRIALSPGDLVIFSSRTIPGNEKAVLSIINGLAARSVDVVTDGVALVHASGHPRRDELAELYDMLRPEVLVPVHGEPVHLAAQAALGKAAGIPEVVVGGNGKMLRLAPGPAEVVDSIEPGLLLLDGDIVAIPGTSGVEDRRRLAYAGCVVAFVILDERFELFDDPVVTLFGIPERNAQGESFFELVEDAVEDAIESIPRTRRRDGQMVAQAARRAIRNTVAQHWGKRPLCKVRVTMLS